MIWKAYSDASILEGVAAAGAWIIYKDNKFFETHQLDLSKSGHPECINDSMLAEAVVIRSLIKRLSKLPNTQSRTIIFTDCKAVVDKIHTNSSGSSGIASQVIETIKRNIVRFEFDVQWISREHNFHADQLSKRQRIERVRDKLEWQGEILKYDANTKSVTRKRFG